MVQGHRLKSDIDNGPNLITKLVLAFANSSPMDKMAAIL